MDVEEGAWLVIGGSQFMGRLIVSRLLDMSPSVHVTMLNRGMTPCPFSKDATHPCGTGPCSGRSRLTHLHCDRLNERATFRDHLLSVRLRHNIQASGGSAQSPPGCCLLQATNSAGRWIAVVDMIAFRCCLSVPED